MSQYNYPSPPGFGPNGQRCRDCKESTRPDDKKGYKCKLNNGTIKINAPACIHWVAR